MADPIALSAENESGSRRDNVTQLRALPSADVRDRYPTIAEAREFGKLFAEARGLSEAEVALKCVMAAELNIPWRLGPTALYLTDEGTIGMHAATIRAAIRKSGRYDYQILENDDTKCTMRIVRVPSGEEVGTSTYTIEDAQKANIANNRFWVETPKAMVLARVTTVCYQNWCPDVFGVPMYDREALIESEVKDRREPDRKPRGKVTPVTTPKSEDAELQAARETYRAAQKSYLRAAKAAGLTREVADSYIADAMKGSDGTSAFALKAIETALARIPQPPAKNAAGAAAAVDPFADDEEDAAAIEAATLPASTETSVAAVIDTPSEATGAIANDPYTQLFEGESAEQEIHAALAETEIDEVETG